MAKLKLREKELIKIGFPKGPALAMAINMMLKHYKKTPKQQALTILKEVIQTPENFKDHNIFGRVVELLIGDKEIKSIIELAEESANYPVYGTEAIGEGARLQMDTAMRLPVAVGGALMADAHHGYGLPIGGVLAVENAVIPFGVGMDIGCRMCLSIYDLKPDFLENNRSNLKRILNDHTRFGISQFDDPMDDPVLERPEFKEIPIVKSLRNKAYKQIGTSGSGNHFVEFGLVKIIDENNEFDLLPGLYMGALSHSGSRGLGATIAGHYTKVAMEKCLLPKEAKHLSWLTLDSEEGMEYWLAMNLAGDYASACHHHIHLRLSRALGEEPIAQVENHHNFAWKEKLADGREVIVHRKGATPAGKGVLGVIPGSMTAPGFIVRGKGNVQSINSASHGAGRQMSRRKAKMSINKKQLRQHLKSKGVELIGGGLDEAPFAYKDIHAVMKAQQDLVEVVGSFLPKIVRMDK